MDCRIETGTIIKSDKFHTPAYWVVKCDNSNLIGNRSGELPIDPLSHNSPFSIFMGKFIGNSCEYEGRTIKFEVVEIGNDDRLKYYAKLK